MAVITGKTKSEEYPKKSGILIRPIDNSHKGEKFGISYQVTVPAKVTGKVRIRKQFPNKEKAEKWADKQFKGFKKDGEAYFRLTPQERQEIGAMVPKLREKGISIRDAIEYALPRLKPAGGDHFLSEVVDELQASKTKRHDAGDLAYHSLRDFNQRSDKLKDELGENLIHEINVEMLKEWIEGIEGSGRTRLNYLRITSEIFRYAKQKKYITENPIDDLSDNDRKDLHGRLLHGGEIRVLTVKEAEDFIHFTWQHSPEFLGVITLGLFCGIRTEELQKLEWEKVNMEGGYVTIDASIAKKRRIRHVTLPENAKEWLLLCKDRRGKVVASTGKPFEHQFADLRRRAGWVDKKTKKSTWPTNGMRHSFGTYHYALHGDSAITSRELGHKAGDDVLFDHYRALATTDQGEAYFGILPNKRSKKVLEFGT
jgi:integrase